MTMLSHSAFVGGSLCLLVTAGALAQTELQDPFSVRDVYADDRIVRVELTMDPGEWDRLRREKSRTRNVGSDGVTSETKHGFTYRRGILTIDGERIGEVGVRKKGFIGSISAQRPSLKLKLHAYAKSRSYRGIKRLTLNNNLQDPSQVKQYLTYKWFRKAGLPAPRCGFARVSVNGHDLGIYSNVEPVKKPMLRDRFGSADGTLYESTAGDFSVPSLGSFETKTNVRADDRSALKKVIAILDSAGEDRAARIAKLVDLDQFIRFWSAEMMLGHWDGYAGNRNNFFVYLEPRSNRFVFLPWGADGGLESGNPFITEEVPWLIRAKGRLCKLVWSDPTYRRRYLATVKRMIDEWWDTDAFVSELRRVTTMIRPAVHVPHAEFDKAVASVRAYVQSVVPHLRKELIEPPTAWVVKPQKEAIGSRNSAGYVTSSFEVPLGIFDGERNQPNEKCHIELTWRGERLPVDTFAARAGYGSRQPPWHAQPRLSVSGRCGDKGPIIFVYLRLDPEIVAGVHVHAVDMFEAQGWFGRVTAAGVGVVGALHGTATAEIVEVEGRRVLKGKVSAHILSSTKTL